MSSYSLVLLVSSFLEHHWPHQHMPDMGTAFTDCLEYMTSSFNVFANDSAALARRINKSCTVAIGVTSDDKLSASMLHIVDPVHSGTNASG